jgi:nucleoid DNA-binding protein
MAKGTSKAPPKIDYDDFLERVYNSSGYFPHEIKTVLEHYVAVMCEVMEEGKSVHVPNLGKFFIRETILNPRFNYIMKKPVPKRIRSKLSFVTAFAMKERFNKRRRLEDNAREALEQDGLK